MYKYIVREMIKDGQHIDNFFFLGQRIYSHFDIRMNDELKLMKKENQIYGHNTKYFAGGG
jgi:hypothetical protein